MKPSLKILAGGIAAALALTVSVATAAVTETDSFQSGDGVNPFTPTYAAPAGDVLLGLTPTTITPNEAAFDLEGAGGTSVLTDGVFGPILTGGGGAHPSFATGGGAGGSKLIYTFASPITLSSVVTLGGWNDAGRDTQAYTVSYDVGGTLTPLATVSYDPTPGGGSVQIASQVILDGFAPVANVDQLVFDFASAENGHQGYAELAATSVPEPSCLAALGGGVATLLGLRRRRA